MTAVKLPWTRSTEAEDAKAVVATAQVRAEALALVDGLRSTLNRLDEVLREETSMGDNDRHG